jgi:ABC-type transport system involved in multi-copper enzyme maturation permease subunit
MNDTVLDETIKKSPFNIRQINPVFSHELRRYIHSRWAVYLLSLYTLLAVMVTIMAYLEVASFNDWFSIHLATYQPLIGFFLFVIINLVVLAAITWITPGLMAGAVASERERQSLDLLFVSPLSTRDIILGKYFSALCFMLLFILVTIPLEILLSFAGNIPTENMITAIVVQIMAAASSGGIAICFSSLFKKTAQAWIGAYLVPLLSVTVFPCLLAVCIPWLSYLNSVFASGTQYSAFSQIGLVLIIWIILSLNPLSALTVSAGLWLGHQGLIAASYPLHSGGMLPLLSPWILFTVFALCFTLGSLWLSIYFAEKIAR